MSEYTYSIFDSDPNVNGSAWPTHDEIDLEAESDEEAVSEVQNILEIKAAGLYACDGYGVGDTLYAIVWDVDGLIVGEPTYDLTYEDLGVETPAEIARRILREQAESE